MKNAGIKQIVLEKYVAESGAEGLYENGELTERFYTLYKNYQLLLEKFLLRELPLTEYDDRFFHSGLYFTTVKPEDKDIYQSLSGMNLRYFFLRNILHVEKLSDEEIQMVVALDGKELSDPSEETMNFIGKTYQWVLCINRDNDDTAYMLCYGTDRDYFWHDSRELIFGFRYDKYADNGLGHDKKWLENSFEQYKMVSIALGELQRVCSETLAMKVCFLNYDDVSVRRSMLRKQTDSF